MAVSRYESNGNVLWQAYVNIRSKENPGVRKQKRITGLSSEQAAQQAEKKLLRELSESVAKLEGKGLTWEEVLNRWEMAMRAQNEHHPLTLKDYLAVIRKWTRTWFKRPASEITRADGRELLTHMEREGKSRGWQQKLKNRINAIFEWGIEHHFIREIAESPVKGLKLEGIKEEKRPEILNLEEIRKLLFEAKRLEHPWYPIWATAMLTGMRNGELHALLWEDVDLENSRITVSRSYNTRTRSVKSTKAGYWRTVPISDELKEVLVAQKAKSTDLHVLPRFTEWDKGLQAKILKQFCIGVGVKPVRFHTLRACFATQLLAHDIAAARVMKICGWRDLKTMQHYIRLSGLDERGATQVLRVLPSDEALMGEVVHLFSPR